MCPKSCCISANEQAKSVLLKKPQAAVNCFFNPLNTELNTVCHLLALLGALHILHVGRIRVKSYKRDLLK
jgi:hypothetical protein